MTNVSRRSDALPLGETKGETYTIDGWQILQTLQNIEKRIWIAVTIIKAKKAPKWWKKILSDQQWKTFIRC